MLHYLPNLQLGSFDDVFTVYSDAGLLCNISADHRLYRVGCMGTVRYDLSGALLGKYKWCVEVF